MFYRRAYWFRGRALQGEAIFRRKHSDSADHSFTSDRTSSFLLKTLGSAWSEQNCVRMKIMGKLLFYYQKKHGLTVS